MYVEELIGPKTVNTMPAETVAFQEHGTVAQTITEGVAEARKLLERLAEVGVDYDDVVATLEAEASEVRRLVRGAAGRDPRQASPARGCVKSVVERIWDYDASLWTDSGEDRWLGWLDVVCGCDASTS